MGRKRAKKRAGMFRADGDSETEDAGAECTIPTKSYCSQADGTFHASTSQVQVPIVALPENASRSSPVFTSDPHAPTSGSSQPVFGDSHMEADDDSSCEPVQLDPAYVEYVTQQMINGKLKRPTYKPALAFLPLRDIFLEEFLRWEGRGSFIDAGCSNCQEPKPNYRCSDCFGGELFCRACVVSTHRRTPTHRIEEWINEKFFRRTTLKAAGLRVQLGHPIGSRCFNPKPAFDDDFILLDITGIHELGVDFCGCAAAPHHSVQLLRFGWFPASVRQPKTAATLSVLKHFQLLNFESKATVFEFYQTLSRLSCNTGLAPLKDRYDNFVLMVREFRHLRSLKRAARGHKSGGVSGTAPGECAVLCPACPQPGINMAVDLVRNEKPHLNRLFLAIDANFRLKRRLVSHEDADPSFGPGLAYFVSTPEYRAHLKVWDDQIEQKRSTCSNHKAVSAERSGKGLASTGVVSVDCARHDMKRPLASGDLHKGERYVNTDYVFFSSIRNIPLPDIVVSYDIACQWSINLAQRLERYPAWMHPKWADINEFTYLIGKFHLPAHVMGCQIDWSFNFNPHVGRTDGEAPERGWAQFNSVSNSTSEMGPGHRINTLDDHFGDSNWKKTTKFPASLLKKVKLAVVEAADQKFLHNQYSLGFPPEQIETWNKELADWEADHKKPNPFVKKFRTISEGRVRQEIAAAEEKEIVAGKAYICHGSVSASQLITMGIDLESEQRWLAFDRTSAGDWASPQQKAEFQERANILRHLINAWFGIQHRYISGLEGFRERQRLSPQVSDPDITNVPLYLPSSLPSDPNIYCDVRLQKLEWELRYAQAHDALDDLRDALRLRSHVYQDKDRFQQGQRRNTRSQGLISTLQQKVDVAAAKYRAARAALKSLATPLVKTNWHLELLELADSDIRAISDAAEPRYIRGTRLAEGHRELSWIWQRLGPDDYEKANDIVQDELRIEYCKGKARSDRWQEEVELLLKEMERVIAFFTYRSLGWTALADGALMGAVRDKAHQEGLMAFAAEQADQFFQMSAFCRRAWKYVPAFVRLGGGEIIPPEFQAEDVLQ